MKIFARYIDDKYWFDVVVENSTTTEIHWRINDDRLLAGMIADIKPNSNGIDLKNKVIYLNKISCDITVAMDNYAQVKEIKMRYYHYYQRLILLIEPNKHLNSN